jgi:hypothetical protein
MAIHHHSGIQKRTSARIGLAAGASLTVFASQTGVK